LTPVTLLFLLRIIVVVCCYCTLSLLYFYNVFSYLAIQPQVCNKVSVQCLLTYLLLLLLRLLQGLGLAAIDFLWPSFFAGMFTAITPAYCVS